MGELGDAYHGVRMRVTDLVSAAGDHAVLKIAPATPDWTVKDNLAHLTGITADIVNGNLNEVGTDEWTAAQVDARRGAFDQPGALRVEHDTGTTIFGASDPTTTLRTTRFEFLRATTGRRCPAQIAEYDWDGGTPPDGLVLGLFIIRADSLEA